MKPRIFKPAIAVLMVLMAAYYSPAFAQDDIAKPAVVDTVVLVAPVTPATVDVASKVIVSPDAVVDINPQVSVRTDNRSLKIKMRKLRTAIKCISIKTTAQVTTAIKNLSLDISADVSDIAPQISTGFKDAGPGDSYNDKQDDGSEQIKNYSKSYSVDGNDALNIENRYGNVTVNTWAKNEFKVDVQIKVTARNDDDAEKMLNNITISDKKDGSSVYFKTNIGSENNSWSWGRHSVHKMEINYIVYLPAKNALTVSNSYGGIILPNLAGKVTIYSAYGSFSAKDLTGPSDIKVKYGSANMGSLGNSNLEVSYGSLELGSVDVLQSDISYSSAYIGKLRTSGRINLKYSGGLKIADVDRNLTILDVHASYSNVNIGLSGDENANFDVTTHYGGFDHGDHNVTVTSKSPSDDERGPHFTYNYKGRLGKGSDEKNISISTSYGSVKFE
jgi:hypothetical protein